MVETRHGVADGRERVPQLVGEHRQELVLPPVGLGEVLHAVPERAFQPLPLGDVGEEDGDPASLRLAEPEGVDVEPAAAQRLRLVLEPHRLARLGHPAIGLEPVGLVAGGQLAHPLARRVPQPGMLLEGRVHLEEPVIGGPAVGRRASR